MSGSTPSGEPLLAENGATLDDAAWSWWTSPRAQKVDGDYYYGVIQSDGDVSVRYKSGATEQRLQVASMLPDDHNNPAVLATPTYPMVVFYNAHNQDRYLRVRVGQDPIEDGFGPLGPELLLNMNNPVSYAVAYQDEGWVWCWCRVAGRYWGLVYTNNLQTSSTSWAKRGALFDRGDNLQKLYMASAKVGETLRCAFANHPADTSSGAGSTPDVWYCEVNLTTGAITTPSGGSFGDIYTNASPVDIHDLDRVSNLTGSYRSWIYSVGDGPTPTVIWADFDATTTGTANATGIYRYATLSGATWTIRDIAATGSTFESAPNFYFNGAQHAPGDGSVYVSRKSGSNYLIERWDTADLGANWTTTVLRTGTVIAVRAWPIIGGGAGDEVVYNTFTDYTSYVNWTGGLEVD